jgi:hypothetical protein
VSFMLPAGDSMSLPLGLRFLHKFLSPLMCD